jgi:hypothetical protein
MAIAIIVEDGTGSATANAYVSIADCRIYAANRGVTLSVVDDTVAAQLIKASDYLAALAPRWQGERASVTQAMDWPRLDVVINGFDWPADDIPNGVIAAQCQLVMAVNAGFKLQPNLTNKDYKISETLGPIKTEWANPLQVGMQPTFTAVDALLAPLFAQSSGGGFSLQTIRV